MDDDDLALGELAPTALHGKKKGWGLWDTVAGASLAMCVLWARPFGLRGIPYRLQVPYVPSSAKQVENMMSLLEGHSGKLVDLGSGDGRIVVEAYRRGFRPAVGYELNPWLLRFSSIRAWQARCHGKVWFCKEDLWKLQKVLKDAFRWYGTVMKSLQDRRQPTFHYQHGERLTKHDAPKASRAPPLPQQKSLDRWRSLCGADLSDCRNVTMFLAPSLVPLLERKLLAELPEDACVVAARFPFLRWAPSGVTGDGLERVWAYNITAVRQALRGTTGEDPKQEAKYTEH